MIGLGKIEYQIEEDLVIHNFQSVVNCQMMRMKFKKAEMIKHFKSNRRIPRGRNVLVNLGYHFNTSFLQQ